MSTLDPSSTPLGTTQSLKQALVNEYGGFADRRIKDLDKGSILVVDTREDGGLTSDGKPFGWFCSVFAEVIDGAKVRLTLTGDVPDGRAVATWAKSQKVARTKLGLRFEVTPKDVDKLVALADAFLAIVARGAPRYPVPSYKYSCPRTAFSLKRLHNALTKHWATS